VTVAGELGLSFEQMKGLITEETPAASGDSWLWSDPSGAAVTGQQGHVLSIQSHTVHGYVGNKCAVFPLQLLGFEVDPVNSVQFSNHTGYANGWRGEVLQGEQLWALVEGLQANGLLGVYSHILTGYIGSVSFLQAVIRTVQALRKANPAIMYFCDPVMGDHGKLYVPDALVAIYRAEVVPLAAVLTPNQFEAELLTERKINSEADAVAACKALHEQGPHTVVITSLQLECSDQGEDAGQQREVIMLASRCGPDGLVRQWRLNLPRLPQDFTGTGDLTAALLLAWSHRQPEAEEMAAVLEKVGASVQAVLQRTRARGRSEICLIEAHAELREPRVLVRAVQL